MERFETIEEAEQYVVELAALTELITKIEGVVRRWRKLLKPGSNRSYFAVGTISIALKLGRALANVDDAELARCLYIWQAVEDEMFAMNGETPPHGLP